MDFDKTSFTVDWYTPSETTYARKRVSFPKSARISVDDSSLDSPMSVSFNREGEVAGQPCSYSLSSGYPQGLPWTFSAPPSQLAFTDCEVHPLYKHHSQSCEDVPAGWRALASLGLDFAAGDSAFSGLDFDSSCLDALDEQLLLSPIDCFTELCWAAAVNEEGPMPARHKKNARSCARSFTYDAKATFPPWTAKDYPCNFEASRPLLAKIMLPCDKYSQYISSSSPESSVTSSPDSERIPMPFLYTDPSEHGLLFPAQPDQTLRTRRFLKKQNVLPADLSERDSSGSHKLRLRMSRSTSALRVITNACTSLTGPTRKSAAAL